MFFILFLFYPDIVAVRRILAHFDLTGLNQPPHEQVITGVIPLLIPFFFYELEISGGIPFLR
jgi:hypothetical protein